MEKTILQSVYIAANDKSASLTKDEQKELKKFRKLFGSEERCANHIGIGRSALNRILIVGSGNPQNIEKIRGALKAQVQ